MFRPTMFAVVVCAASGVLAVAKLPRAAVADAPSAEANGTKAGAVPEAPREFPPIVAPVEEFAPSVRLGDARLRHPAPVKSLAFNADGTRLLTATREEPVLRLWDVATGRLLREVRVEEEYTSSLTVLALTPDGKKAFVVRHQTRQRVSESHKWHEPATVDLVTGAVMRWPLGDESEDLHPIFALSPDGKTLAGRVDGELRVWEFANGAPRTLGKINGDRYSGSVCFSPDGKQVAACGGGYEIFVGPIDGTAPLRKIAIASNKSDVRAVFWPKADRVVALWSNGLAAHDPTTGTEQARREFTEVNMLPPQVAGGGTLFVKQNYTDISAIDLATLAPVPDRKMTRNRRDERFDVSANGKTLAVVTGHAVRLFNATTGEPLHPELERAPYEPATRLHVSNNGTRLLACADNRAQTWELPRGRLLTSFESGTDWSVAHFALSPNGKFVAGGFTSGGYPLVRDTDTGRESPLTVGTGSTWSRTAVGFAGNDRVWVREQNTDAFIATNPVTNATDKPVAGMPGTVFVAVSQDGRRLAAAGWFGLGMRDLDSPRGWETLDTYPDRKGPRCGFSPPPCGIPVRFSPCNRWLLVWDNGIEVWDIRKNPKRLGRFGEGGGGEWTWRDAAFSPDGRRLAAAVRAKDDVTELRVWELASATEIYRFRPRGGCAGCAFTPDGKRLVIAHRDTTLSVWDCSAVEARQLPPSKGDAWDQLLDRDASRAQAAVRALLATPAQAVILLEQRTAPADAAVLNRLIADLGSEDFATREAAFRALAKLGLSAEPALHTAATKSDSSEVRARALELLKALGSAEGKFTGERLRTARAVEVLERVGTPEAKALLKKWAADRAGTLLGTEAKAALERLPAK